jgi:uncharacterized protein YdcH (DUF465 family)
MPDRDVEIRDVLVRENDEYRRLYEKHQGFEERLAALNGRVFLSDQEQLESTKIKKEKLRLKDRMAAIARDYLQEKSAEPGH